MPDSSELLRAYITELSLRLIRAQAREHGYAGEPLQRMLMDRHGRVIEITWISEL